MGRRTSVKERLLGTSHRVMRLDSKNQVMGLTERVSPNGDQFLWGLLASWHVQTRNLSDQLIWVLSPSSLDQLHSVGTVPERPIGAVAVQCTDALCAQTFRVSEKRVQVLEDPGLQHIRHTFRHPPTHVHRLHFSG